MRKYLFILILLLPLCAHAQMVTVDQKILDKCADTADALVKAKDVIAHFEVERGVTANERIVANNVIKSLNDIIDNRGRIIADMTQMQAIYEKLIALQTQLIDKLTAQANKGQSAFSKFIQAVEKIALLALGITVGRGL